MSYSLRQELTPDALRGRVFSLFRTALWGVWPLGALAGGLLATWSLRAPLLMFAFISLAIGAIAPRLVGNRAIAKARRDAREARVEEPVPVGVVAASVASAVRLQRTDRHRRRRVDEELRELGRTAEERRVRRVDRERFDPEPARGDVGEPPRLRAVLRHMMKLRGSSAAQNRGTEIGVVAVSPAVSGVRRSNAQRTVASSQSW